MNASPRAVAFVPARGGSKRVPGKNVRMLGGHPLLAYSIAAARGSGVFDDVIISTDDAATADISRSYGAEVPFLRPAPMAADHSRDIEWVEYTIERLLSDGRSYDAFSILRPTSPFRTADTIRRAWQAFRDRSDADSLRAVEKCKQHPGKMWVVEGDLMRPLMSGGSPREPWHSTPYQALPPVFVQNASLEIAWVRVVKDSGTIAGERIVPFLTDEYEGFDINDTFDWWLAEELLRRGEISLPSLNTHMPSL
ncbi:MAG: acylneuraminate cytidylyltransferase family protein [Longimicrobiales bacterium]